MKGPFWRKLFLKPVAPKTDQRRSCSLSLRWWLSDCRRKLWPRIIPSNEAWLGEILEALAAVDVRPQRGNLRDYPAEHRYCWLHPVVMPENTGLSSLPTGKISMGATHEWDELWPDSGSRALVNQMETKLLAYPELAQVVGGAWNWATPVTFTRWGDCSWSNRPMSPVDFFVWPHLSPLIGWLKLN